MIPVTKGGEEDLQKVFSAKTKLEQFFQLLFWIQEKAPSLPLVARPPGILEVLLAARVFRDPSFPGKIRQVTLLQDDPHKPPRYRVEFSGPEVHFPLNGGTGFAVWDQKMCQTAKELIFTNGFSFRLRPARNSPNLIVDDMEKVQLFGQFGTRRIFNIDLQFVDLEKVEFLKGTDEGRVTCRVARREFLENKHSALFQFIGSLIPNTARQRIDW